MLSKSFKSGKCKTSLKLAVSRIKLLKNRREIQVKQLRRELAQLLDSGQEHTAKIRVEHAIREEKTMSAYELIEIYCELIVARLPIIESQKSCPIDLKEAVCSLIFASPRCADIPELMDVRKHFVAKYGKEFVTSALELRPECGVSRMIVEKLSAKAPDVETKIKILTAVAKEHDVKWDSKAFEEQLQKPNEDLLNGPNSFSNSSKMPIDSLNAKLSPDTSQKELASRVFKTSIASKPTGSNSSHASLRTPSPLAPQYSSASDSENKTGGSESKDSYPVKEEIALNRSKWKMEFEDAASAAQVAAESAERASMAARAAAELASRGNISRQNSNELTISSIHSNRNKMPDRVISSNTTEPVSVDYDQPKGLQEMKEQVNKLQRDEVVDGSSHSSKNSEDDIEFSSYRDAPMEQNNWVQESFSRTAPMEQNSKYEARFDKEDIEIMYDRSASASSAATSNDDTFLIPTVDKHQTDRNDSLNHDSPKIGARDVLSRCSSDEQHISSYHPAAVFDEYSSELNNDEGNLLNLSWKKQDQVSSFASTTNVDNSNLYNNSHQEKNDVTLEKVASSKFDGDLPVTFDDSDGLSSESEDDKSGSLQNDAVQHQPLSSLEAQSLIGSENKKKTEVPSSFLGAESSEMSDGIAKEVEQGLNFGKLTGGFKNRGYILPPYSASSVLNSSSSKETLVSDTSDAKTTLASLEKSSTSFENADKERDEKSSWKGPLFNSRISSLPADPVSGKTDGSMSENYTKGSSCDKTSGEDAAGFSVKQKIYERNNRGAVLTPMEQIQYDSPGSSNPNDSDLDKTLRISELDQKIYELKKRAKAYKESISRTPSTDVDPLGNRKEGAAKVNENSKTNTKLSRRTRDSPSQTKKTDTPRSTGSSDGSKSDIQREPSQGNPAVEPLSKTVDQSTSIKLKEKQRSTNPNSSIEKSSTQTENQKAPSGHGSTQEANNESKGNQKPSESGSGGILPDSYLKNASHVHPKLPDYDTLAAHFQSLRSNRRQL